MSCSTTANGHEQPALFNLNDTQTVDLLEALYSFKLFYGQFHRYISLFLCTAGILANVCHISVLTHAHMRKSSVHTTLTCIAIADVGTMTSYLIYITRYEFLSEPSGYGFYWAEFLRLHAVVSIALHAVSLYFVVFMAFIRLMALDIGQSKWMMPKLACIICITITIVIVIICVPTFLAHQIYKRDNEDVFFENSTTLRVTSNLNLLTKTNTSNNKYSVGFSKVFLDKGCALLKFNLWLTGLLLKALPCFLLFWFTIALLRRLRENERKRCNRFFRVAFERTVSNKTVTAGCTNHGFHKRMADRTTYVLILMLSVFLLTELPQGLFAILNAMYTYQFHSYVYMSIADVLDLLSLINCYVAFIVYMLTSSTYRNTLFTMLIKILPESAYYNKLTVRQQTASPKKNIMHCVVTYGPALCNSQDK